MVQLQDKLMLRQVKNVAHRTINSFAHLYYGSPGKKMTVIGVTGTDGKTTTSTLIHHILTTAGIKAGISGTLSSAHTTTPGSGHLQKLLSEFVKNGCTHAVIEVTSIAVDQHRIAGIGFDIGVLTNIANNEHLDYHGTFEKYKKTKFNFLKSCKVAVLNADDPSFSSWHSHSSTKQKLLTYAIKSKSDISPKTLKYKTNLLGQFNHYNILAAIAVAKELKISDEIIQTAIETFVSPPGRLEIVTTKPFTVIVDFAHTPQAFEKVLQVARGLIKTKKNKLIHVFGATGDRDRDKRPIMSSIASKFDDFIFLTTEDTYSEDPKIILAALEKGLKDSWYENYKVTTDRKEAIRRALNYASKGDVVILTGVGHQKSMNVGGKEIPWSEQKTVKEILKIK